MKAKLSRPNYQIDERLITEYKQLTGLIDPFERSALLHNLSSHKRYVIAVTLNCSECDESVVELVDRKLPMDIYVVAANDQEIQTWARRLKIPVDRVRNGSITLNRDNGQRFAETIRFPVMYESAL